MNRYIMASAEFNATWMACLERHHIEIPGCPSDNDGAAILRKWFPEIRDRS